MSICTNCVLLVCLYDVEGKWKIEPGLAAILIMEHVLLLIKFGFSRFVPEVSFFTFASMFSRITTHVSWENVSKKNFNCSIINYRTWKSIFWQEPAWVRANRMKNATHAQHMCSKQLLRSISGGEKMILGGGKKTEWAQTQRDRCPLLALARKEQESEEMMVSFLISDTKFWSSGYNCEWVTVITTEFSFVFPLWKDFGRYRSILEVEHMGYSLNWIVVSLKGSLLFILVNPNNFSQFISLSDNVVLDFNQALSFHTKIIPTVLILLDNSSLLNGLSPRIYTFINQKQ